MSSPGKLSNIAFKQAYDKFFDSLSNENKSRFPTQATEDDLLQSLQDLQVFTQEFRERSLTRTLDVVKTFNEKLRPLFAILDSTITEASLCAGAVFAAIRVVLELASCFPTFLKKLLDYVALLSENLSYLAEVGPLCSRLSPERFLHCWEQVYHNVLDFLREASAVFGTKKGRMKKTVEIIATIHWKSFDQRFSDILQSTVNNRQRLIDEMRVLQLQATVDLQDLIETLCESLGERGPPPPDTGTSSIPSKETTIQRIVAWLQPPHYASTWHESLESRWADTAQWLCKTNQFEQWRHHDPGKSKTKTTEYPDRLLWVNGSPGSGKTVMAASVLQTFTGARLGATSSHEDIFYFFFRWNSSMHASPDASYRSILSQVLTKYKDDVDIVYKLSFACDSASGQTIATTQELEDMMLLLLGELDAPHILLDGVDECLDAYALVSLLQALLEKSNSKILLFSRLNVQPLLGWIPPDARFNFNDTAINDDIRIYLRSRIRHFKETSLLRPESDAAALVERLVLGAGKMFLWATLMVSYLRSPALTQGQREKVMWSITVPEGLEKMYDRIFELISVSPRPQQELAYRVLSWVVHAEQGPTVGDLQTVMQAQANDEDDDDPESIGWPNFPDLLPVVTCGLVSCCHEDTLICNTMHLSATEYIKNWYPSLLHPSETDLLRPSTTSARIEIAIGCLTLFIRSNGHKRHHFLREHRRIMSHAAHTWTTSLTRSVPGYAITRLWDENRIQSSLDNLRRTMEDFLEVPQAVATFVEAFLRHPGVKFSHGQSWRPLEQAFEPIESWAAWVSRYSEVLPPSSTRSRHQWLSQVASFQEEMKRLSQMWGQKLVDRPALIWEEVAIFGSWTYLPQSLNSESTSFVPGAKGNAKISSHAFCHVSATSRDGKTLGVLSVWPSAEFEKMWHSLPWAVDSAYSMIESLCSGWQARYQLFSVEDNRAPRATVYFDLEEAEIRLQLRQAFRKEGKDEWKASFPLAISPDGLSICILRTVYRALGKEQAQWSKSILPLDKIDELRHKWTAELCVHDPTTTFSKFRVILEDWYTYSITLSADGRYAFFSDNKAALKFFVMFELTVRGSKMEARQVSCQRDFVTREKPTDSASFHPNSPVLAFSRGPLVRVWNFGTANPSFSGLSHGLRSVSNLSFSTCGEYLVVSDEAVSKVIRLDSEMFAQSLQHRSQLPEKTITSLEKPESSSLIMYQGAKQSLKASEPECRFGDNQELAMSSKTGWGGLVPNVRVGLSQRHDVVMEGISPQTGMTSLTNVLVLPETINTPEVVVKFGNLQRTVLNEPGYISVVLNKPMEKGYSFQSAREELLPMVVKRPIDSLTTIELGTQEQVAEEQEAKRRRLLSLSKVPQLAGEDTFRV